MYAGHHCWPKVLQLGWCLAFSSGSIQNTFWYHEHWSVGMNSLLNALEKLSHEARIYSLSSLTGLPDVFYFVKISKTDKPLAGLTKR